VIAARGGSALPPWSLLITVDGSSGRHRDYALVHLRRAKRRVVFVADAIDRKEPFFRAPKSRGGGWSPSTRHAPATWRDAGDRRLPRLSAGPDALAPIRAVIAKLELDDERRGELLARLALVLR
jgi:hypothetical protein